MKNTEDLAVDYDKALRSWRMFTCLLHEKPLTSLPAKTREVPTEEDFHNRLNNLIAHTPNQYWRSLIPEYEKGGTKVEYNLKNQPDPTEPSDIQQDDTGTTAKKRKLVPLPATKNDETDNDNLYDAVKLSTRRNSKIATPENKRKHTPSADEEEESPITADGGISDVDIPLDELDISATARKLALAKGNRKNKETTIKVFEDDDLTEEINTASDEEERSAIQRYFELHVADVLRPSHSYRYEPEAAPVKLTFRGQDIWAGILELALLDDEHIDVDEKHQWMKGSFYATVI